MPRLTTTLAAAGLATVIASTVLTSLAGAADDCLSGPNPEIAGGSRWHYRVDRQNHRKCWYRADENRKSERAVPVRVVRAAKKPSPRVAERMLQPTADARAEVPVLAYTEPFMDGPRSISPEEPVPRGGSWRLNADPSDESPALTPNAGRPVPADAAPRGSAAIARREPAEPLPAYDSSGPTVRLALSLLLVATGLGAVTGAVVFRRSGPLLAPLNGDPFHGRGMESAQCLDEMTPEEMTSLALARDLPLFLVRGRIGAD